MKNLVFLAHWSLAFIEEQFFAFYSNVKRHSNMNCIYFCDWDHKLAVTYLVETLFDGKLDAKKFPDFLIEDKEDHCLQGLQVDDTLFVVQLNPSHLRHFLIATGGGFPKNYVWWQIEQQSYLKHANDNVYANAMQKAKFICDYRENNYQAHVPFSSEEITYCEKDCSRVINIAQHQSKRLAQDNPSFQKHRLPIIDSNQVLLLGTCDVYPRKYFKRLCTDANISILHPHSFHYLFALERQTWIRDFVCFCHNDKRSAIAVNIHQHLNPDLETAKIYLLLANGIDVVLSERSTDRENDLAVEKQCNGRLKFFDKMQDIVAYILMLRRNPVNEFPTHQNVKNSADFDSKIIFITKKFKECIAF